MYDSSLKRRWDNKNVLDYAKQEGREMGMAKGIEIGKYEVAVSIAKEMKKEGMPIAQILKYTKLSIEEIENL